jgi:bifunctional NMN adenylyltransferase/nudix hydrolase
MKEFQHSLILGRFQPFHLGHLDLVKKGLEVSDQVIIMIGSKDCSPNIKNPFTFEQRKEMIQSCLSQDELCRIVILGVRDYHYSESQWLVDIQNQLSKYIEDGDSKVIIGNVKDSSSYYLKYFPAPEWDFLPHFNDKSINDTDVRVKLFGDHNSAYWQKSFSYAYTYLEFDKMLPITVFQWLYLNYLENTLEFQANPRTGYADRVEEYEFIRKYRQDHAFKKDLPYKPIFSTVDSLVICSGHVLIIKRKMNPGKGLYALPGGFIKENELLKDAALRELREETKIKVSREVLENSIQDVKVFDNPSRSLRGRTITHCHVIKLKDGTLPEVKAGDDAETCMWMTFHEIALNFHKFYEDHASMIQNVLNKY